MQTDSGPPMPLGARTIERILWDPSFQEATINPSRMSLAESLETVHQCIVEHQGSSRLQCRLYSTPNVHPPVSFHHLRPDMDPLRLQSERDFIPYHSPQSVHLTQHGGLNGPRHFSTSRTDFSSPASTDSSGNATSEVASFAITTSGYRFFDRIKGATH